MTSSPRQPVRITRAIEFSSSLRHVLPDLDAAANRARFGRESERHGHNYRLEVTLCGEPDAVTGMVMDLKELSDLLEHEVMARFDHRDLNDDTGLFDKRPPTPENLAAEIADLLRAALPAGLFDRLRLYQDADTWVDVIEEPARGSRVEPARGSRVEPAPGSSEGSAA